MPQYKACILDEAAVSRALKRISHEILERNHGCRNVALIGICRRGVPLAHALAENIAAIEGAAVPVGQLDITLYRDDISPISPDPVVNSTTVPFEVTGKHIVLVDDVLYTGRTARAAIDALIALGRPSSVQLAVLIDRGHREFPIRGDYIGKNIPTSNSEMVAVNVPEFDGKTSVDLYQL